MALLKMTTIKNIIIECVAKQSEDARVSEKGVVEFSRMVDDFCKELALKSWRMAQHAQRTTIKPEDVLMAMELMRGGR
jgi:histone H3/H4